MHNLFSISGFTPTGMSTSWLLSNLFAAKILQHGAKPRLKAFCLSFAWHTSQDHLSFPSWIFLICSVFTILCNPGPLRNLDESGLFKERRCNKVVY